MSGILSDLRIVEVSAFIAAPLGGMTLAQMGADVIRIDPIGGNIDAKRWPLAPDGTSLYWASLNKSKRSVTLALNTPEGQEIAQSLIRAPGKDAGILLTNLPAGKWMGYDVLKQGREDLIVLRLMGNTDGGAAIDYTVNCASGFPLITGRGSEPVNHVLPAWDIATGLYLSTGLLADLCFALPEAEIGVMNLPAMSRITKIPLERLESLSLTSPVFAPGVENYLRMGAIEAIWQGDLEAHLDAAFRLPSDRERRRALGEVRGGRQLARSVAERVRSHERG